MSREENIEVVKRFYASLKNLDFDAYFGLLDPDIEFRMNGNIPLSGTWRGHEGIGEVAKGLFELMEQGQFCWGDVYRIVCADGDGAVALSYGGGKTKLGRQYNQAYAHIFKIRKGKIYRFYEFFDTVLSESALYGNDLTIPEKKPGILIDFMDEPVL